MANETYWLGEKIGSRRVGQILVDGRLYGIGEPFPAEKLDKERLNRLRDNGCVGDVKISVAAKNTLADKDRDIALLQGKIAELEGKSVGTHDLEAKVSDLEQECELLTTDNEEKAALIAEQKAEIKALKKEAKK